MGNTYYIAATGGSDSNPGTYSLPFATRAKAYSAMVGGDRLVYKDGTYTTLANMRFLQGSTNIKPPYGSSVAGYTTVEAETPGGVIFDYNSVGVPFEMQGSYASLGTPTYMKFDGFVFKRMGGWADFFGVNHVKVTRSGFSSHTATGNNPAFQWDTCTLCLMEDCYFWGRGRYKVIFYRSDKLIGRRLVARIDDHDCFNGSSNEPLAGFAIYRCTNSEYQNCINIDSDQTAFWRRVGEWGGGFLFPTTGGSSNNNHLRGCIVLKSGMGFGSFPANNGTVTVTDCVGWDIVGATYSRNATVTINRCTFGVVDGPPWYQRGTANEFDFTGAANNDGTTSTNIVKNTILYAVDGRATRNTTNNNNALWGNTSDGTLGTGTKTAVNLATAIEYPFRVTSPLLIGQGDDGGNIGADVTKKIGATGSLWGETDYNTTTADELWPWPYEDVIGPQMRSYTNTLPGVTGTISGDRGFAVAGETLTNYVWNYLGHGNPYQDVPDAPVLTATTFSDTQITLTWTDVDTETTYVLERSTSPDFPSGGVTTGTLNATGRNLSGNTAKTVTPLSTAVATVRVSLNGATAKTVIPATVGALRVRANLLGNTAKAGVIPAGTGSLAAVAGITGNTSAVVSPSSIGSITVTSPNRALAGDTAGTASPSGTGSLTVSAPAPRSLTGDSSATVLAASAGTLLVRANLIGATAGPAVVAASVASMTAGFPAAAPVVTGTAFDGIVLLTWEAVTGAALYTVEHSLDGSVDWEEVGFTALLTFAASGLENDVPHFFRVKGDAEYSPVVGPLTPQTIRGGGSWVF